MGENRSLIKGCPSTSCNVYPYRFGKNPMRQGIGGNVLNFDREPKEISQGSLINAVKDKKVDDVHVEERLITKLGSIG